MITPNERGIGRGNEPDSGRRLKVAAPSVVLTIAGFDPSTGAGITADLQVFAAHGLFGVSAITALTVQSTQGVAGVEPVSAELLGRTLRHLAADFPPAGVKIGMLATAEIVAEVAGFLRELSAAGDSPIPIVCDPAVCSSSGAALLSAAGITLMRESLLDQVGWVTPNWSELAMLTDREAAGEAQVLAALHALGQRYPGLQAVATGGEGDPPVDLLRVATGEVIRFAGERVETTSTHGTGCAFSSALLSRVVLGDSPEAAVAAAKRYVEGALRNAPGVGGGRGPMDLLWPLRRM